MTCYLRHLSIIFDKAGIEVTRENRRELGKIIQNITGGNANCSEVWRQIKKRLAEDEAGFIVELKTAWEKRQPARD